MDRMENCIKLLDPNTSLDSALQLDLENADAVESDDEMEEDEERKESNADPEMDSQDKLTDFAWGEIDCGDITDLDQPDLCQEYSACVDELLTEPVESETFSEHIVSLPCFKKRKGYVDDRSQPFAVSMSRQLANHLTSVGGTGCSLINVKDTLHLSRSECRSVVKHNMQFLDLYKRDEGRQRTQYHRLKKFKHLSNESDYSSSPIIKSPCKKRKLDRSDLKSSVASGAEGLKEYFENRKANQMTIEQLRRDIQGKYNFSYIEVKAEKTKQIRDVFDQDVQIVTSILDLFEEAGFVPDNAQVKQLLLTRNTQSKWSASDLDKIPELVQTLVREGFLKYIDIAITSKDSIDTSKQMLRLLTKLDLDPNSNIFTELVQPEIEKFLIKLESVERNIPIDVTENTVKSAVKKDIARTSAVDDSHDTRLDKIKVSISKQECSQRVKLEEVFSTGLMVARAEEIIRFLNKVHISIGKYDVQVEIFKCDAERNYNVKIDRKTLDRMLQKLAVNGYINKYEIHLKIDGVPEKKLQIFSSLQVSPEHPYFQSALKKEKVLLWSRTNTLLTHSSRRFNPTIVRDEVHQDEPKTEPSEASDEVPANIRDLNSYPKFTRLKILHKMLFNVAFGDKKPIENQSLARKSLEERFRIQIPDDHPPIYDISDLDHFTFLPSVLPPTGYPKGFLLFSDIYPILPVCVFMQCINLTPTGLKELMKFYTDPIKRFYPLRDTSPNIYASVTQQAAGRKYVATMYDNVANLSLIGLVQMGKRCGPNKECFIFYLNKNTSLKDTTKCASAYLKLEDSADCPTLKFQLNSVLDIDQYWQDMTRISLNTPLGLRSKAIGETVSNYKKVKEKPELMKYCQHIDDPAEILARDDGTVPGDQLGASGFDSSIYVHLKRNWHLAFQSKNTDLKREPKVEKIKRGMTKPSKLFKKDIQNIPPPTKKPPPKILKRLVTPRQWKKKKSNRKSEAAHPLIPLSRMRTRIKWTQADSDFLHVAHFLYALFSIKPCPRLTADVHNKIVASSITLTGTMLARFYLRMKKSAEHKKRRFLLHAEIKHNEHTFKLLSDHLGYYSTVYAKGRIEARKYFIRVFGLLVKEIFDTVVNNEMNALSRCFPRSYNEYEQMFSVVANDKITPLFHPSVMDARSIQVGVLTSVIHSSLTISPGENLHSPHLLFKAYQRYPESTIQKAVRILRNQRAITISKKGKLQGAHSAVEYSQFKLSQRYCQKVANNEIPVSSFHASFTEFKEMVNVKDEQPFSVTHVKSGFFHLFLSLIDEDLVCLSITGPRPLLLIDPKIGKLDKNYQAIVDRYHKLVEFYKIGTLDPPVAKHAVEDDEVEDEEPTVESMPPMNPFNAARLAMYTLKDVLAKEKINVQHCHRLLTLNTCKIDVHRTDWVSAFYNQEKSRTVLNRLENRIVIPALAQDEIVSRIRSNLEKRLADFIESKLELGATVKDIKDRFGENTDVQLSLETLVDNFVVIKSGLETTHFVHNRHCSLWLLKTQVGQDDEHTREILIAPWVSISGVLNRRVLDTMLGCVLSYILCRPGISLLELTEHFSPILLPFHTTQLVEILVQIECVTKSIFITTESSLFSTSSISKVPCSGLEPSSQVYLEGQSSAALKLGMFIGDKSYSADFLANFKLSVEEVDKTADSVSVDKGLFQ